MGAITAIAAQVFREWAIDGVPSSGTHRPDKADIRDLFRTVELGIDPQVRDLRSFGAAGDGVTNDYAAIVAAIDYCVANDLTLAISDGTYCHASTIQWAYPRFRVIATGANVIFKHTGTGVAHSFNGLATGSLTEGVFANVFGGPNRIRLHGNPAGGTTGLVYVNNWHWSEMKISGRDAQYIVYGANSGAGQGACVESLFDIDIRQGNDGVVFAVKPDIGIRMDMCYASTFIRPTVEQCGSNAQPAVQFTNSNGNLILGGTFESNLSTGLYIGPGCNRNTFINLHNEANGLITVGAADFSILGDDNRFISCAGAQTPGGQYIAGNRNVFTNCMLQTTTVVATANGTRFENCQLLTAFVDSGIGTSVINPSDTGITGAFDNSAVSLRNKTINTANGNSVQVDSIDIATAWATYTPTITSQGGTPTTVSASGRWKRIGKTVIVEVTIVITDKGTATGSITATLPINGRASTYVGTAYEQAVTGRSGSMVMISSAVDRARLLQADATTFWASGYTVVGTLTYEVP
ncbi:hypothetical protein [Bradyrhizobium sp. DOA1]|uniref:hypothetical protein n=1 Tax=Bradyrhizobium sp. DOA1 TaxID=1126616 RepID=UPI00077C75E8|nr:hypothetical protein [Bradyrhizobium sp. DOA1]KYH01709.1 hypothetical protein SE91_27370 [Bradyrhizobium sp. DOA1]